MSHSLKGANIRMSLVVLLFTAVFLEAGGSICLASNTTSAASGIIIDKFISPDVDARPMARMWFTDAGAGASPEGLAMVEKQIRGMADGGMGGVEIAFLADDSRYDNEAAKEIGWGSENWRRIVKKILKTANSIEKGFKVDITITAHWPPLVNNIDPNDDEASQNASYAYRKITTDDIAAGVMAVPLPKQRTEDHFSPMEKIGDPTGHFLFRDKFVSAAIAKVVSINGRNNPVFELSSMTDVSKSTSKQKAAVGETAKVEKGVRYAGYPVGVPDEAYCRENGIDYVNIINNFGPEPSNPNFEGKIDADGNRKRMADWQYLYKTDLSVAGLDLSASAGEGLAVGDYVLIGSYYRGTGQVMSGGTSIVTRNRCWVPDYFSSGGVAKIVKFWNDHILDDEMLALLKENGGKNGTSIFEDSIEIYSEGAFWTQNLVQDFADFNGYDVTNYISLLTMGQAASFDDTAEASRILEDYNLLLGDLFSKHHAAEISNWAKGFNYTYRAQAYGLTGLDHCGAALAVDVPEGDNGTSGDGIRKLIAAVNMKGAKMMSMEATTFAANINSKWCNIMKVLNGNFSDGINRVVLHGSGFSRNFNGFLSAWPGWNFFKGKTAEDLNGSGFSAWNHRQIWWDDADTPTGYMARTQAVMQNGQALVDLAVLVGTNGAFSSQRGNSLQTLLDNGYSYNLMSEPMLKLDNAVVKDGVLAPEGPAYRALIVQDATKISVAAMKKILSYAKAGLPVIFHNCRISSVYGTNKPKNNDDMLAKLVVALTSGDFKNVTETSSEKGILSFLSKNDVSPAAIYKQSGLEVSHRKAAEGDYYYFFNDYQKDKKETSSVQADQRPQGGAQMPQDAPEGGRGDMDMPGGGPGAPGEMPEGGPPGDMAMPEGGRGGGPDGAQGGGQRESEGFKYRDDVGNRIVTTVTLEGEGVPYMLNAWSGEMVPVAQYEAKEGKITLTIDLYGREATIVCIAEDPSKFPDADAVHALTVSGGEVLYDGGQLVHRAEKAGTYKVTLSDDTKKKVKAVSLPDEMVLASGWDLSLESWGPTKEGAALSLENNYDYSVDPTLSEKKTIVFSGIGLGAWSDLPATSAQLSDIGVEGMDKVSGIGTYTTTFELSKTWKRPVGAYMTFAHHSDMIAEVTINDHVIRDINQMRDRVDVGDYLTQGENTLTIKLDTTLQNRDPAAIEKTTYGLTGVSLIPYYQTVL